MYLNRLQAGVHKCSTAVVRHVKLRKTVLGVKEKDTAEAMDIKRYAKYLLEEGTTDEKRELLAQLRGKLVLKDKKIEIAKI